MAQITWLTSLISALIVLYLIPKSSSKPSYLYHFCSNDTIFASNSQYNTNRNTVFRSLSTNSTANPTGFYTTSAGTQTTNPAYGLFLCRGDQNVTACNNCVNTATTTDLPKKYCSNRKIGVIWYEECMVRYSNTSFLGKMDQSPSVQFWDERNITGNQTRFTEVLGSAMDDVAIQAANDLTGKKFATRVVNVSSSMTLYALGQCTPDLTPSDCNLCLRIGIGMLSITVDGSDLMPSCNVRYATYPFFLDSVSLSATSANTGSTGPRSVNTKASSKVIVAVVAPLSAILVVAFIYAYHKKAKMNADFAAANDVSFTTVESLQYDLATLQTATNQFSLHNKLGEGGFGGVYKGILPDGKQIAVKRLSRMSSQGAREFKNEVLLVAKLQHRNLVKLLGFCLAGEEKLLVYECVANKSLDCFLFDVAKRRQLNWETRYKIIVGIARGMLYLHQDSRPRIIHRDLKASNVLLDVEMSPKVADFGMARMFSVDQTHGNTMRVVGTYGYMSPEYAMRGQFSVKSDVYSYGVIVLEIISGKRNTEFYLEGYAEDLLSYAWKKWKDGVPLDVVDPTIREHCSATDVTRCLQLGLLCVQQSQKKRPTMATVVHKLDDSDSSLPVPEEPAFFIKIRSTSDNRQGIRSDQFPNNSMPWSVNDLSITNVEPR